jgi:hypothetical protein
MSAPLPDIIIKLRDKIELTPPEEQRFAVVSENDLEVLINMVNSFHSVIAKMEKEQLNLHRKYQTATELVVKVSGDKRMLMRERDIARKMWCIAAGKLRRKAPAEVARGEQWNYLFK